MLFNNNIVAILVIVAFVIIIIKVSNKLIRKVTSIIFTLYTLLKIFAMCGIDISKFIN